MIIELLPERGSAAGFLSGKTSKVARRIAFLAVASSSVLTAPAIAADSKVDGYWLTQGGTAIVEIAPCGSSSKRLCGNTVWVADASAGTVGVEVLKGFRPEGRKLGDRYGKGKVIQSNGSDRTGKLKLNEEGTLTVSSCKGSRCNNVTWTRPSTTVTASAGLGGAGE